MPYHVKGDPRGCYIIVSLTNKNSAFDKSSILVEFICVTYDIEKATEAIEKNPLPNEFADS